MIRRERADMKLLKSVLVLLVLLLGVVVKAQTGQGEIENWVEVRGICAEERRGELIQIEVADAITEIIVNPDATLRAWAWYVGEAKSRRFWIDAENSYVAVTAFVGGGGFPVNTYFLGSLDDCESADVAPVYAPESNECLGIAFTDFVNMIGYEPIETGFVVDGLFYNFNERLSFIVPVDAVWVWDLYVDGRLVLRFEQDEGSACHVSEVYPQ